ncbi:MAG: metalloregulator ArsR/SmtB family transcription factor [Acidobacteriota bacterium]
MARPRIASDVFRAVADPTRRELLDLLAGGDLNVMKMAESFQMSLPAISQHLKVLREAGLVRERSEGRMRLYTLVPGPLEEIADWVGEYETFWQTRLGKLGEHLRKTK